MNINYLKDKNIHFIECENWHNAYGYEKSQMKEDTINYIEQLQQENKQLKDNWNKLKEQEINRFNESQDVQFLDVLQDMQELEQGSDSNGSKR